MDIHHIGPEHISKNISGVYLRDNIPGHGYTSHWSGAYLQKYLRSVSPEYHLQTWIYITLVRSISPKISPECISGITSPDMDIHHIGPEHISKNISRVICGKASPEKHLWTWIYITLVQSISPKISLECISRITSLEMDIYHIGPEHISENISGMYLQNNISGHGYISHWSGAYLQKYLQSYLWKNISGYGYTSHW